MTRPNSHSYPPHHPYYGRPLIEVTDHDVLCGRGVNISQHPGNERFRALVNTRQDASYCSGFTTSEKRALAEEIVAHIRNLDPPGRFLKRLGRSQSSRGLHGPWEELTHRECIKKTCQALRDCNRQDRQGYAATVTAPTDVAINAEERARSGLSLKEHAAAAAAAAARENSNPLGYSFQPLQGSEGSVASNIQATFEYSAGDAAPTKTPNRLSPTSDLGASWLKKQCTEDPLSVSQPVEDLPVHVADPVTSNPTSSQMHATPSPFVAPVPVSTTPPSTQAHSHINSQLGHDDYHHTDHLVLSRHTDSPQLPSPTTVYHHHHHDSMAPAPYSPVVLLHDDDQNLDPHAHLDDYNNPHGHQTFDIHHPFSTSHHHDEDDQHEDILQTAAAAAASSMGNNPHHHRDNSLSLLHADDDGTHESLHLSDL